MYKGQNYRRASAARGVWGRCRDRQRQLSTMAAARLRGLLVLQLLAPAAVARFAGTLLITGAGILAACGGLEGTSAPRVDDRAETTVTAAATAGARPAAPSSSPAAPTLALTRSPNDPRGSCAVH